MLALQCWPAAHVSNVLARCLPWSGKLALFLLVLCICDGMQERPVCVVCRCALVTARDSNDGCQMQVPKMGSSVVKGVAVHHAYNCGRSRKVRTRACDSGCRRLVSWKDASSWAGQVNCASNTAHSQHLGHVSPMCQYAGLSAMQSSRSNALHCLPVSQSSNLPLWHHAHRPGAVLCTLQQCDVLSTILIGVQQSHSTLADTARQHDAPCSLLIHMYACCRCLHNTASLRRPQPASQQQQAVRSSSSAQRRRAAVITNATLKALIFDCDGVIVETEELHRLAYNAAFQRYDVQCGELLTKLAVMQRPGHACL